MNNHLFDPTTLDKEERLRLMKSKWLLPLVEKPNPLSQLTTASSLQAKSHHQDFYKRDIKQSISTKRKIAANGNTRFILDIRKKALDLEQLAKLNEIKEQQAAISTERKWNMAKQNAKSPRFAKYIQELRKDQKITFLSSNESIALAPISKNVSLNSNEKTIPLKSIGTKNSLLDLRQQIDKSPFKPKDKSLTRNVIVKEAFVHDFGKPPNLSEEAIVEVNRLFKDLVTLGSQCKEKWAKAVIDKEDFNIRKGFESLERSKSKPKQGQTKIDPAKRVVAVRRSGFQRINPFASIKDEYTKTQIDLAAELKKSLQMRENNRFELSKNPDSIVSLLKVIDYDIRNHIDKRCSSTWFQLLPHLYQENPYENFKERKRYPVATGMDSSGFFMDADSKSKKSNWKPKMSDNTQYRRVGLHAIAAVASLKRAADPHESIRSEFRDLWAST